jgi:hypothetical protein
VIHHFLRSTAISRYHGGGLASPAVRRADQENLSMTRSKTRRFLFALTLVGALPLFMNGCAGCKKPAPADDAAPPPPPAATDAPPLDLTPLDDDAGDDAADASDAGKHWTGPGVPVDDNIAKIRACCAAMANQAAHMQNGPEKGQLQIASVQCNGLAAALTPGSPAAAQTAQIRAILAANKLPGLCSF